MVITIDNLFSKLPLVQFFYFSNYFSNKRQKIRKRTIFDTLNTENGKKSGNIAAKTTSKYSTRLILTDNISAYLDFCNFALRAVLK